MAQRYFSPEDQVNVSLHEFKNKNKKERVFKLNNGGIKLICDAPDIRAEWLVCVRFYKTHLGYQNEDSMADVTTGNIIFSKLNFIGGNPVAIDNGTLLANEYKEKAIALDLLCERIICEISGVDADYVCVTARG